MNISLGLTFDDVLLIPQRSSLASRKEADTSSPLSQKITLKMPIISANMDTVTESEMAIAMALEGGIGFIHRFMPLENEVEEVKKVKRAQSFVVEDPLTLVLNGQRVKDALSFIAQNKVTGLLIVNKDQQLLGILTHRDLVLEDDVEKEIKKLMTPREKIITGKPNTTLSEAKEILRENKIEKLPLVDSKGVLKGLITRKDILHVINNPYAQKDKKGHLMVGAAIGVVGDYLERAQSLVNAGADVLVVDIAHGHADHTIACLKKLKSMFSQTTIVAGNVASAEGTLDLIKAGADVIKVGVGPGSMCTTRIVTGHGVPQLTAITNAAGVAKKYKIPIIADGGIRYSGDIVKALAAGASTVMIGSLLTGTQESPGMTVMKNGRKYKMARGMASLAANWSRKIADGKTDNYGLGEYVAEGVEALVPYRGSTAEIIRQLVGGLRSGMSYCGVRKISDLAVKAKFIQITNAGLKESFPHDVEIMQ